jgi:hypothetical protein
MMALTYIGGEIAQLMLGLAWSFNSALTRNASLLFISYGYFY